MGESYFNLKRKLEELGYNNSLSVESVPLVECLLADLLQTTRSLQHYMDLSKEALIQRDSMMLEAEPYKCDNAKLIQDNNQLHKEIINIKEENLRLTKESKRKIKSLSDELKKKDCIISKLQHDVRDLSLRGLCANTQSSRIKSKRQDGAENSGAKLCICNETKGLNTGKDVLELTKKLEDLEEKNSAYYDEIMLLKNQVEHRDNEIIRLNILLEGGRPLNAISKDCCNLNSDSKIKSLMTQLHDIETENNILKKELETGLEKQHEAMLRALTLADKNKNLQDELQKVDALALKVEEDCNKQLTSLMNEINYLQTRIEGLTLRNSQLERDHSQQFSNHNTPTLNKIQESLNISLKEKEALQKEIKDLVELNKSLQDKIVSLSQFGQNIPNSICSECEHSKAKKCPTKNEFQMLLENERKKNEKHMLSFQEKLTDTIDILKKHLKCKDNLLGTYSNKADNSAFVRDLHAKLCESEQKLLMIKKENDELRTMLMKQDDNKKQNFKDVIHQLNMENSELSKENIALSQQLSHYRTMNPAKSSDRGDNYRKDIEKQRAKICELEHEISVLRKDKQEYNLRCKGAFDLADKLKRDIVYKQKEIERLEEENSSYKVTNRSGKASVDKLKEECYFLKEQIKKMQTDVIKEKTLASQIKNIQLETERSNNEIHNDLLCLQKKLSIAKDTIDSLEKKCNEMQSEIATLKMDKSNLVDNMRKIDIERDKLVIELDNKTECVSVLEQKIKSQTFDIKRLEDEVINLKRMLNMNKVSEHKLLDSESQINFLNGEILRLTQQYDSAVIENKHLQNSLADANGTLKVTKIEYEKSRKEVEGLKQQLQHYVAEIRRIEELLSQKEAERSDMLEHFASLSVEANILENTNHSLESESASKSLQLQNYNSKVQSLENKLLDKDNIIDSQSARIASMSCKITTLENEIQLINEEKIILQQNISYLKKMCNNLQSEHTSLTKGVGDVDSELKLYENKIKSITNVKAKLETERDDFKEKLKITEKLLSNARKEIVDLKLALQDATSETKSLHQRVSRLERQESDIDETMRKELELPLMLEETIHEVSHEEDEDSSRYHEVHKRFSRFSHSGTI